MSAATSWKRTLTNLSTLTIFDFALDRALRQISDYSCRLNVDESNPEKKVAEFISFLPVLAYDGSTMKQINAQDVLDIAMAGTSATLLAKRWESALLVNVDNETLSRLLSNKDALDALMRIEGFRSLNQDTLSEAIEEIAAASDVPSTVHIPVTTKTMTRNEQPKKEFDCSGITVGMTVTHAKFGNGKIVNIDKARKYLRVSFSIGEKTFVMPNCFESGFLKFQI